MVYIAAAPVVGQHRHECKQQPHHAVLHRQATRFSSCLLYWLHGINMLVVQAEGEGVADEGKHQLWVASPAG